MKRSFCELWSRTGFFFRVFRVVRGKNGCRPDGAEIHLGLGFYKDATPTAFRPGRQTTPTELKSFSPALVVAVRQHLRWVTIQNEIYPEGIDLRRLGNGERNLA